MFEIDLSLRTFGESGLLTSTLETFHGYYAADGQAQQFEQAGDCWERTGLLEFEAEP